MNKLNYLLSICIFAALGFNLTSSQGYCPPYEEPAMCADICNRCEPRPCPYICIPGCQCIPGFTRDSNMNCIPKSECPVSGIQKQKIEDNPAKVAEKERILNWLKVSKGCPRKTQCRHFCLKQGPPYKDGVCIGPNKGRCLCVPCVTEDPNEDGGKSGCPITAKCSLSCQSRKKSNYKSGICIGPRNITCQCLSTPPKHPLFAEDSTPALSEAGKPPLAEDGGGCPNPRSCIVSCQNRGFKTGLCLGPKKEYCNCYLLEDASKNVSSRENSICPDFLKCVAHCQDENWDTGYCAHQECRCIQTPKGPIIPREK